MLFKNLTKIATKGGWLEILYFIALDSLILQTSLEIHLCILNLLEIAW